MIFLLPLIGLFIGIALALIFVAGPLPGVWGQYMAVACLAGLDTVCGGIRGGLEGKFHIDVFVTGFISNCLIAGGIAWLGDKIYIPLYLAVALVLGARIFTNLSLIRRFLLTKWQDARERQRLQRLAQQQAAMVPETNT
ncbi:MAG: small basic family protein [Fimbriimonas ginsengisoli]|uniref:Small basic family protein n=1 Tax=Fimbriimonas ginsengisoli TaxID=1005039 RepID=A0A931LTV9_FIMGI|nr:small basic family protein [Fimbriimonas ginsengisoli]